MVVRKRKKSRKLRGRTRTMGWGRIGQHRKSGSRGGFGAVGFHKHKATWMIKYSPNMYGKHGFTSIQQLKREMKCINIDELNELVTEMISSNTVIKEGELVVVNTVEMGYDKVLGRGKITIPIKLITKKISEVARKKVEEAGGRVVILEEDTHS